MFIQLPSQFSHFSLGFLQTSLNHYLQVENLEDCKKKYTQQINELETTLKETQSQLKRIQDSYSMLQQQLEVRWLEGEMLLNSTQDLIVMPLQLRCDDAEFSNKEKIRLKDKITELTNEIDNLRQKAENTKEISETQSKMEKEISKLRRTIEVPIF